MKIKMHVLNVGYGNMEGTDWANAQILADTPESVDDGDRFFKGCKTAKISITTNNNQDIAKRLGRETFPQEIEFEADMAIVGGKTQLKILDFVKPVSLHQKQG